jgi:UBA-like domain
MSAIIDKDEILQSFMAITSESSVENATDLLEASNYSLDEAVNFFFSHNDSSTVAPTGESS